MKFRHAAISVWVSIALAASAASSFAERPPNIIFVLADDLGWAELGCYGNGFNETPHLDALAAEGMRFSQAYAAAPVCSPYRAAFSPDNIRLGSASSTTCGQIPPTPCHPPTRPFRKFWASTATRLAWWGSGISRATSTTVPSSKSARPITASIGTSVARSRASAMAPTFGRTCFVIKPCAGSTFQTSVWARTSISPTG